MIDPALLHEASLWEEVRRCHASTNYYRLGDDPEARRALNEWEAVFVGMDGKATSSAAVIPFRGRRR
jgi:hypothetical protein